MLLSYESWAAKLAYLSDIFFHLNELNTKKQGKGETIFSTTDKIECFKWILKLWLVYLEKGSTKIFPNLCLLGVYVTFIPLIVEHLNPVHKKFGEYFRNYGEEWNWIRNPFSVSATEASVPLNVQEELVTIL
jgi:hypothetical protein